MTPTGRSLALLRRNGYFADVVERWIPLPGRNIRRDCFGAFDLLAAHPVRREIILVQVTTAGHVAHRLAKIKGIPELPGLLAAGLRISVHGWACRGGRWHCRIVHVTGADLPAVAVTQPARRQGRFRAMDLFTEGTYGASPNH